MMKEQHPQLQDADLLLQKITQVIEQKKHATPASDVINVTSSRGGGMEHSNIRVSLQGGERSIQMSSKADSMTSDAPKVARRSEVEQFQEYLKAQAPVSEVRDSSFSHASSVTSQSRADDDMDLQSTSGSSDGEPRMRRAKMCDAFSTEGEVMSLIEASSNNRCYDVVRLRAMPLDFMLRCYLCRNEKFLKGVEALKLHRLREHDVDPETYSSYQCCRCTVSVTSALQLNAHLEVKHDMTVPVSLIHKLMVCTDMDAFSEDAATKLLRSQVLSVFSS